MRGTSGSPWDTDEPPEPPGADTGPGAATPPRLRTTGTEEGLALAVGALRAAASGRHTGMQQSGCGEAPRVATRWACRAVA
jgi:hypothetical protein